tara:strand:- start:271 stop:1170 length:900 start_codon:yes stop_codon:yes gene_type:complete
MRELIKSLSKLKLNYELGKKTWFGTGGSTTLFLEVHSKSSLKKIIKLLPYNFPIFIVGAGSNLIVRDGGFKGLTLKLTDEFKNIDFNKQNKVLKIGGGLKDHIISNFCYKNSIGNFEFLRGIPGTLGGNIKMNAGCFGKTISDDLIKCRILNRKGEELCLDKRDINFSYRRSDIPDNSIILDAEFSVKLSSKKHILKKTNEIIKTRTKSQPIKNRTGGSTFKNPPNVSAWKLIDKINYRGKKIGDASVSTKHTNFLINNSNANSLDLEILGEEIKESVKKKFNINLDWELKRIGEFKKI